MMTGAQMASQYALTLRSLGREREAERFTSDYNTRIFGRGLKNGARVRAVYALIRNYDLGMAV